MTCIEEELTIKRFMILFYNIRSSYWLKLMSSSTPANTLYSKYNKFCISLHY